MQINCRLQPAHTHFISFLLCSNCSPFLSPFLNFETHNPKRELGLLGFQLQALSLAHLSSEATYFFTVNFRVHGHKTKEEELQKVSLLSKQLIPLKSLAGKLILI